jgi:hypothetical protein
VHRLLVPALFLACCTKVVFLVSYFAPTKFDCAESYAENKTNSTGSCLQFLHKATGLNTPYVWKFVARGITPVFAQAWFNLYLFLYSQLLAFNFSNWHSKHGDDGPAQPTCCGKETCNLLLKPFSLFARLLCCMNICCLASTSPGEFTAAIKKLLMGPIKLSCIPGFLLAVINLLLTYTFPDARGSVEWWWIVKDWWNHAHFIFVFFWGICSYVWRFSWV